MSGNLTPHTWPSLPRVGDFPRHGVELKVILDRSNRTAHYSAATFLAHAGIPVWIDGISCISIEIAAGRQDWTLDGSLTVGPVEIVQRN